MLPRDAETLTERTYAVTEQIAVNTLLGIRFWDYARNRHVRETLIVSALTQDAEGPLLKAFQTASGIYAFQGFSGLRDIEYAKNEELFLASPPLSRKFYIEVRDPAEHFLPLVFSVTLPLPYRGLYPSLGTGWPGGGSPPCGSLPGFLLFSAPSRQKSAGLAVIRGELAEGRPADSGKIGCVRPAAHAIVEIEIAGCTWYGIADGRGRVAVQFPYPMMNAPLISPPLGTSYVSLHEQHWDARMAVYSSPDILCYPAWSELPTLESIFKQLKPEHKRRVYQTTAGSPVSYWTSVITYGREHILRSEPRSSLLYLEMITSP